jgi:very-short-patch-repair endonuclease
MTPASSPLDDAFLKLVRRAGLPEPRGQKDLLGHPVDYVWVAERVAVELDGYDAHVSLDAFQRDRSQANRMQLAGWLVLRFTKADVTRRPRQTAETLRQALGRSMSSIR